MWTDTLPCHVFVAMMRRPLGVERLNLPEPLLIKDPVASSSRLVRWLRRAGKSVRPWRTWDAAGWIPGPCGSAVRRFGDSVTGVARAEQIPDSDTVGGGL